MRVFTVRSGEIIEISKSIKISGGILNMGKRKSIPARGFDNDIITHCDIYHIEALGSDELPAGSIVLIPEVTVSSERALVLIITDSWIKEIHGADIVVQDVTDTGGRIYLMIFYPDNAVIVDKYQIVWANWRLIVHVM
jgi:hypothetical protein